MRTNVSSNTDYRSELDRVKTNMLTSLRSMLKDVDKTNNEQYIRDMQATSWRMRHDQYGGLCGCCEKVIPTITAKEVSDQVKNGGRLTTVSSLSPVRARV